MVCGRIPAPISPDIANAIAVGDAAGRLRSNFATQAVERIWMDKGLTE